MTLWAQHHRILWNMEGKRVKGAAHLTGGSVAPIYLESRSLVGSLRQENCECQVDKATEQDAHTPASKEGQTRLSPCLWAAPLRLGTSRKQYFIKEMLEPRATAPVSANASGAVRGSGSKGKRGFISSAIKLWSSATSPFMCQSPAIIPLQHLMLQIRVYKTHKFFAGCVY